MIRLVYARASVLVLAFAVTGCALTLDASHLGVPASLASAAERPDSGVPFRVTQHAVYMVLGLVQVKHPNLEDMLASQVGKGTRVTNLRVKVRSRLGDLLVTGLTLGLVVPRSVTLDGMVVGQ